MNNSIKSTKKHNTSIINALRKKGLEVKVEHFRYPNEVINKLRKISTDLKIQNKIAESFDLTDHIKPISELKGEEISPLGGVTSVQIFDKNNLIAEGTSQCVFTDNYCRCEGVKYALTRALVGALDRVET